MFTIKICGIRDSDEERLAANSGADAVGLNFFVGSKRYLDADGRRAFERQSCSGTLRIGVFVNAPRHIIGDIFRQCHLDAIQLHGDEPPELVADLAPLKVVKAFRGIRSGQLLQVRKYVETCQQQGWPLAAVLIDSDGNGSFGGTGRIADWGAAQSIRNALNLPVILAGGLNTGNVQAAIRQTGVTGVDVASGVERNGYKDSALVAQFVSTAKAEFARIRSAKS